MIPSFFNEYLTGQEFIYKLQSDIDSAEQIKFVIAYINDKGVDYIGRQRLIKALKKDGSFGVTSLSCGFGFDTFVNLNKELGATDKLKLFLSFNKEEAAEESHTLLHSKIIYLKIREGNTIKQVLYVGSHNWTGRALGANVKGNNAEASLRLEFELDDNSNILKSSLIHLEKAYKLKSCFNAVKSNLSIFSDWIQLKCPKYGRGIKTIKRENYNLLLCIGENQEFDIEDFAYKKNHSIYLHIDNFSDSERINDSSTKFLLLFWVNTNSFENQDPPIYIFCEKNTDNLTKQGGGVNQIQNTVGGFEFSLSIKSQSILKQKNNVEASFWDLKYFFEKTDVIKINLNTPAVKQILLKIETIIPPKSYKNGKSGLLNYSPGQIPFFDNTPPSIEPIKGVATNNQEINNEIYLELKREFNLKSNEIDPVLIIKHIDPKSGYRLSKNPLNKFVLGEMLSEKDYYNSLPVESFSEIADFNFIKSLPKSKINQISKCYLENLDDLLSKLGHKN